MKIITLQVVLLKKKYIIWKLINIDFKVLSNEIINAFWNNSFMFVQFCHLLTFKCGLKDYRYYKIWKKKQIKQMSGILLYSEIICFWSFLKVWLSKYQIKISYIPQVAY